MSSIKTCPPFPDAFTAALAKEKKAELITGDPEFKALEKEIKVTWLKWPSHSAFSSNLADRP